MTTGPIDDRELTGEFTSEEETGPVVLWPTSAIEGAMAERERLLSIIDRAGDRLEMIDTHETGIALGLFSRAELEALMIETLNAVLDARNILAEADPPDPESSAGADVSRMVGGPDHG